MRTTSQSWTTNRSRDTLAAGLALTLLVLLVASALFAGWVFLKRMDRLYRNAIFPNVYALGVDLGGKSPQAAARELEDVAPYVDTGLLVLHDGEGRWSYPWSSAGLQVDVDTTVAAAYAKGRDGTWREQASVWLYYQDVQPQFAFDEEAARALLTTLSADLSTAAVDPTLALENGQVVVVPGRPGRVLDIPTTLTRLRETGGSPTRVEVELAFEIVPPMELDASAVTAQADAILARRIQISAYDILTEEVLNWTLAREDIATWLYLVSSETGEPAVAINQHAIRETLVQVSDSLGDGRGFHYDEAAAQVLAAFNAGEPALWLYLTHPERTYTVQSGDTLTSLSAKHGMPAGLVAEANPGIDVNRLYVGQQVLIPSQDVLTPYMPVMNKKIVVSLAEQRARAYENGQPLYEWVVSTGLKDSPTHQGQFQVLGKEENAYASQWDLWMPYFVSVYPAGGGVMNGFHELPILSNGQRLWAGTLGSPASYGCIILGIPDAETLYTWAEVGVPVRIE